jgi:hypothetical protein
MLSYEALSLEVQQLMEALVKTEEELGLAREEAQRQASLREQERDREHSVLHETSAQVH